MLKFFTLSNSEDKKKGMMNIDETFYILLQNSQIQIYILRPTRQAGCDPSLLAHHCGFNSQLS
jgi:hypothetical protein